MRGFYINTAKVIGSPDAYGWSQIHDFKPSDAEKLARRGRLVAVLSIKTLDADSKEDASFVEQVSAGREILTRFHEEYYGGGEEDALVALRAAVEKIVDEFSSEDVKVEIGAAALFERMLCGACSLGAKLMLFREGNIITILGKGEVAYGSGWMKEGDVFLLVSSGFGEGFTAGVIKGALESGGPQTFVETFAPLVRSRKGSGAVGALVFGVEGGIEKVKVESEIEEKRPRETGRAQISGLRMRMVGVIDGILSVLPERRIVVRPEVVDFETRGRRRSAPLVGFMLLLILVVSIFFGVRQRGAKLRRQEYETKLTEAQHLYQEAESLAELNTGRARELVIAARNTVNDLESQGIEDKELRALSERIDANLGRIAGVYEVQAEMYLDLGLIASGFVGDELVKAGERMLVLDKAGRRVVAIEVASKKTEVVAGPSYLTDALGIAAYGERVFVLSSDGIRGVEGEVELLVKPEWDVGKILIGAFAGNLYVLEKDQGKIWRYAAVRLGFADKQNWFGPGVQPDLSKSIRWAIDGSVWVLNEGGRIMRFSLGSPQSFSLTSFEGAVPAFDGMYTDEDTEKLYLLDRSVGRVLVFDKEGQYQEEYLSEKLKEVSYFVVSEEQGKIIFMAEGKLWEIGIKGLD